jgi:hypothetical protein
LIAVFIEAVDNEALILADIMSIRQEEAVGV